MTITVTHEGRWELMREAADFFMAMWTIPTVERICVENSIPHRHACLPAYDQIIQPWQFGHEEMKGTCLWLRGLPELEYTDVVGPPPKDKRERRKWARVHQMSPGPRRWKARSKTYAGIAEAMAEQWGEHL